MSTLILLLSICLVQNRRNVVYDPKHFNGTHVMRMIQLARNVARACIYTGVYWSSTNAGVWDYLGCPLFLRLVEGVTADVAVAMSAISRQSRWTSMTSGLRNP